MNVEINLGGITDQGIVAELVAAVADVDDLALTRSPPLSGIGLPRFGLGKSLAHNLALLAWLADLRTLGAPILLGLSRKTMIGQLD